MCRATISNISFEAPRGVIVGIAGIAGNGEPELLATLAGLAVFEGTIEVNGVAQKSSALRTGEAYVPADRHEEGLMMSLSVRENAAVSALRRFKRRILVNRSAERAAVSAQLDALAVKAASMDAGVASLSGGNQQKVALARALLSGPSWSWPTSQPGVSTSVPAPRSTGLSGRWPTKASQWWWRLPMPRSSKASVTGW